VGGLDPLASAACTLPDRKCLRPSVADDVEEFRPEFLCRVLGSELWGCLSAASEEPSLRSALVRALSFIGTGISSSELSSWYWCWASLAALEADAGGSLSCLFNACLELGRLNAWRCEVLRTPPVGAGVGEAVAMSRFRLCYRSERVLVGNYSGRKCASEASVRRAGKEKK
jgi:hypothetical protein